MTGRAVRLGPHFPISPFPHFLPFAALALVAATPLLAAPERVCETPDSLVVETPTLAKEIGIVESVTRLPLYVWVPRGTREFVLGVFDQPDDTPVGRGSVFTLSAPDGTEVRILERGVKDGWAEYPVETSGRWGTWRLSVSGPEPPAAPAGQSPGKARNFFRVRTRGQVDLYLHPEASVRARGVRFAAPRAGGPAAHRFTLQVPPLDRVRFHLMRPKREGTARLEWRFPPGAAARQQETGLERGSVEALEVTGSGLEGLWRLDVRDVAETYALGIEQPVRVFFHERPLMPAPRAVPVTTTAGGQPAAVRLEVASPQTASEPILSFTDGRGAGTLFLLPGVDYRVHASRGFEFGTAEAVVRVGGAPLTLPLTRVLTRRPGWYCGDNHTHTTYYDGTHTPAQVVAAARGAGLDWVALTEHGQVNRTQPALQQVFKTHAEGLPLSDPPRFLVIPGEEFTTQTYHANILNGFLEEPATASLQQVIDAAQRLDTAERPVTVKMNHPTLGGAEAVARATERIPLLELWNSAEPQATRLWWDLLNQGKRVFAETSSDSHHAGTAPPGHRRTYLYLGDEPLSAASVVRALRAGRGFLSRGALLHFTLNGQLPGSTLPSGPLKAQLDVESAEPLDRIEVLRNGEVLRTIPCAGKTRLQQTLDLPAEPGWYIAQAWPVPGSGGTAARITSFGGSRVPLALTNPIFVADQKE